METEIPAVALLQMLWVESTEQAIQRRSAVGNAAEYGSYHWTLSLMIFGQEKNVVHAPLKQLQQVGNVCAFAAIVPRNVDCWGNQRNPHWQYQGFY